VGLDVPTYTLVARDSFASYTLQLGQQDATGAIYYGLVNAFETVVLIDAGSVGQLVSLFDAPPRPVEMTPEATAPVGEATAEATAEVTVDVDALNLTGEATPEATEAMVEMTEEVEATEAMVEMTEEVEATEVMVEMTEEADNTIAEATEAMVELPAETNLVVEDIEGENVTALTITANDGDNSDVLAFVRTDDGTWTVAEETTIEIDADLNQLAIDFAVTTFLRTTVSEGDVTADDLATVGLDAPDYEVTVVVEAPPTTDEATADPAEPIVYRVRVGSLNDERFGFYALLGEDDETVYVIAGAADIQMAILNLFDDLPVLPAEGD